MRIDIFIKILCIVFGILLSVPTFAQTGRMDSLRHKISFSEDGKQQKQSILNFLQMHRSMNADTLLRYANILKSLAQGDTGVLLMADVYYAYYYTKKSRLDTALFITQTGINTAKEAHNNELYIHFLYLHAVALLKNNNQKQALEYFFKALKLAEKYKSPLFQKKSLNGIGWVYLEMNQPREAMQWLEKALRIDEKDREGISCIIYLNMTACSGMMGDIEAAKRYNDLSLSCADACDDLMTRANALAIKTYIVTLDGDFPQALRTIRQALNIRKTLNDPFYLVSDMATLAVIYSRMNAPQKGIKVAQDAIKVARTNNLESKLPVLYNALIDNYKVMGDYKSMAEIMEQNLFLKDTLFEKAKAKDLAEMQAKYETEKKETAIRLLQKENELKDIRNRNTVLLSSGIFLIILGGGIFLYIFFKVRQKKRLAEERATMELTRLKAVMQTQEQERKRISAELHDGIGPILSAVKLNVGQLEYAPRDANKHEKAMQLLDQSYKELRSISHMMMPAILVKTGLVAALRELADTMNSSGALKIFIDSDAVRRYDETIEFNLYRIVQELINNIVKYAQATETHIQMAHENGEIRLMIEDNGQGYDTRVLQSLKGQGWNNIVSRLRIINGSIEVDSQPGKKGTVVFISAPV